MLFRSIDGEDAQIPIMMGTFPGNSVPINLFSFLEALSKALLTPLVSPAAGASFIAASVPVIDIVANHENKEQEKIQQQVTTE